MFHLHRRLPYRKMLVLTGVLVGVVLVVMIGGTALTLLRARLDPAASAAVHASRSGSASWFEIYPYYETIAAQLFAAAFVVGSYYLAEYLKVTRPVKRGRQPAVRATAAP